MEFRITDGASKEAVAQYIAKLPETGRFMVTVTRSMHRRTVDQNRLYWLWISCMARETGNSKEAMHDLMRGMFLGKETVTAGNREAEVPRSTKGLDTEQFTNYLERIRVFAAEELSVVLPDPQDLVFRQFEEHYRNFI